MTENEILNLSSGVFRIESARMYLKSRGDQSFSIAGAGTIEILPDGILQATLLSEKYDRELVHKNFAIREGGKIIQDEAYFDLDLNDVNGNYWKSERVLINSAKIIDLFGNSFKCKLSHLDRKNEFKYDFNQFIFYISNKYKIPVNKYENFPNGGFSLNHCSIEFNDIDIKIKNKEKYYYISVYDKNGKMTCDESLIVLEAISLATGSIVHPFAGEFFANGETSMRVYGHNDISLCPPAIKCNDEPWNHSLGYFILSYLHFTNKKHSRLYAIWHATQSAYKS